MVPRSRIGHHAAITMTSPLDGRVMFTLPWGEFSYIGTTDTDFDGDPAAPDVLADDIVYLLRSANAYFPNARLTETDIVASWAGLRALVAPSEDMDTSDVPREHTIVKGPGGMLTIAGGKLTTYRRMAAELVDLVADALHRLDDRPPLPRADTAREPLPGGEALDLETFRQAGLDIGLPPDTVEHLLMHYGAESAAVCNLVRERRSLMTPLCRPHPSIEAEVIHVTRRELAERVDDVLVRRLHLYYETRDQGVSSAKRVAELMGEERGWDAVRVEAEASRYREGIRSQGSGVRGDGGQNNK
jgi:glycerol-3-phosphate dehydrogenase